MVSSLADRVAQTSGKNVPSQLQDHYAVKDDDILHGIMMDDNS